MAKRLQENISQMSDKTRLLHWLGKIGENPHCPFCGRLDPETSEGENKKGPYVEFTCTECHAVNRYSKKKVEATKGEQISQKNNE